MQTDRKSINWSQLVHFNDKQKEAEQAVKKYKYILYGGAMGGGKSYWLRWMLIKMLMVYHERTRQRGIRVGLFCEDYPSLKDRHVSKMNYELPTWLGQLNKGDSEYVLHPKYGSGVIALRNLDDPAKYASSEFASIGVDEITKDPKIVWDMLRTRLRWTGIIDPKFLAATNPGGVGHGWVKAIWMDGTFEPTEKESALFHYVRATAEDNRMNLPSTYFDQLEGLPEEKRKAYLFGDWNLFEGQFFSEWRDHVHVVDPFPIPDTWRKFGGYDHGRAKPACFKWYALDFDANVWVYRELYVNREDGSDRWEADRIAQQVAKITKEAGEHLEYVVADSSIFSKIGASETIAEILMKNGMGKAGTNIPMLIPSTKDRIAGWTNMHQYLYHDTKTPPKMHYFRTCFDSIRTIPSLVYDEHKFEDLDSGGEDHAADTDSYFLATLRNRKTKPPKHYEEIQMEKFQRKMGIIKDDVLRLERFANV